MQKSFAAETTNITTGQSPGPSLEDSGGSRSASKTLDVLHSAFDFCYCGNAYQRNTKRVPVPPRHVVFFQRKYPCSNKRHSCPSFDNSPYQSTSFSPPPVQTSLITGPDPSGWKLRGSPRGRSNRLSLQIALPAVPDAPIEDLSSKIPLRVKPNPPRRHSESSVFLRPPVAPVTPQDLRDVQFSSVLLSDDPEAVFEEVFQDQEKVKVPPPVPEKNAMARQIAQLIALSRRRCRSVQGPNTTAEKNANRGMGKPSHLSRMLAAQLAGLHVSVRQGSIPRFPG